MIPARFVVTLGHLVGVLLVFKTKSDNVYAGLSYDPTVAEVAAAKDDVHVRERDIPLLPATAVPPCSSSYAPSTVLPCLLVAVETDLLMTRHGRRAILVDSTRSPALRSVLRGVQFDQLHSYSSCSIIINSMHNIYR